MKALFITLLIIGSMQAELTRNFEVGTIANKTTSIEDFGKEPKKEKPKLPRFDMSKITETTNKVKKETEVNDNSKKIK